MVINYDCRLIGFNTVLYPVHAGIYTDAPFEHARHDTGHIDRLDDNLLYFGKNNIKNIYDNIIINHNNVKIELALFHLFNLVHEITIYDTYLYHPFYSFYFSMAPYETEYSDFIDSDYTSGDLIKYLKKSFNYNLPERLFSLEEIFELDKSIIKYRVSAIF